MGDKKFILREYKFSHKEFRNKLGIKGEIVEISKWDWTAFDVQSPIIIKTKSKIKKR